MGVDERMSAKRIHQGRPIRIVPLHGPPRPTPPPPRARAVPAAELTYRGGPLLTAVQAVSVLWGAGWAETANRATAEQLAAFLKFVVASPYVDQLAEYNTPQHKIGRGTFGGTATVTDPAPDKSVTDAVLQRMLEGQVAAQRLPAATANTLYVVFLPPGVTVVAGSDRSCEVFCGYHDRSGGGLYYAVVPYPDCAGCLAGLTPFEALTSVCSHELAEAITDPVPGGGWYDDANGEIGDVCAWQNKRLGDYLVQKLWSNRAGACV
jgi:hypothetical protein